MIEIVEAEPKDVEDVRRLAMEAFSPYGDYGEALPRFFATQGVTTYLAKEGDRVRGFVMLGFLPWTGPEAATDKEWWMADLLAIAVEAEVRQRGLGRRLMQRVEDLVSEMAEWRDLKEIQLSCAEENEAGLAFFKKQGFVVANQSHGSYSGGQAAWRLVRKL